MGTVEQQEQIIASQKEQLYGAEAEILRLQRELHAAERRAEDADVRAAACMRERDDAAMGVEAANSAAAEEARSGEGEREGETHTNGGLTGVSRGSHGGLTGVSRGHLFYS